MTNSSENPLSQQQALDWFTRLRDEKVDSVEREAFEAWIRVPQNAQAYAEVEHLW